MVDLNNDRNQLQIQDKTKSLHSTRDRGNALSSIRHSQGHNAFRHYGFKDKYTKIPGK